MTTTIEPSSSVAPLERPRVTEHLLTGGEMTVELPVAYAGNAYAVTVQYNPRSARSIPCGEVQCAEDDAPVLTALVPAVLYAALGAFWRLETAAVDREDGHSVTLWHGAYEAVFAFRGGWLDAQADDLGDSPEYTLLVLPGVAAPPLAMVP